jgi:hypothetical protein
MEVSFKTTLRAAVGLGVVALVGTVGAFSVMVLLVYLGSLVLPYLGAVATTLILFALPFGVAIYATKHKH